MSPEERTARGARVRALLEDPDVKDALAMVEDDLLSEWKKCHDVAERENLWRAVNTIDRLKTYLLSMASSDLTAMRRAK